MNLSYPNLFSLKKKSSDWLGIDIGTSTIKVVSVSKVRGEWSMQLRRLIPAQNGEQINVDTISDGVLEQHLQEHLPVLNANQHRKVACVLSSSVMELQTVELPLAQPAEVRQMLKVEFDSREDGLSREFDFFENEKEQTPKAETSHWSVLSVPTKTATGLAESLWKQGIHCERLNTLPCVLAQAVQLTETQTSKPAFALDWGATSPSLTLIVNGRPIYSRLLRNCGLQQFLHAGCEQFECLPHQFCEMLNWVSLGQPEENQRRLTNTREAIQELCSGVLEQLSSEIERTLAYVKQEYPGQSPEAMWLFGGGAMVPDICNSLEEKTSLRTSLWQIPQLRNEPRKRIDPLEAMFGSAIVLSMLGRSS